MKIETKIIIEEGDRALLKAIPHNPCISCKINGSKRCICGAERNFQKAYENAKKHIPEKYVDQYIEFKEAQAYCDRMLKEYTKARERAHDLLQGLTQIGLADAFDLFLEEVRSHGE